MISSPAVILYSDILYCDCHMVPQKHQGMPEWDY
jgi:hypothetical protein